MSAEVIGRLRRQRDNLLRESYELRRFKYAVAPLLGIDDPDSEDATERAAGRIKAYKDRIQDLYRETIRLKDQLSKEHSDVG